MLDEFRQYSFRLYFLRALRMEAEGHGSRDVAKACGVDDPENFTRRMTRFKVEDYPAMEMVVDAVREEGLLKKANHSYKEAFERRKQALIQMADKGGYPLPVPEGWTKVIRLVKGVRISVPVPFKNELNTWKKIVKDFLDGDTPKQLSDKYGKPAHTIEGWLKNPFTKGEFEIYGKKYVDRPWKLFTPEEWDEIQSRFPPKDVSQLKLNWGYMWKNGEKVLKPWAKEIYQMVFELRKLGNTVKQIYENDDLKKISKSRGLTKRLIQTILHNREITGKVEIDGKLVDSGLEVAVSETLFNEVENMDFPNARKLQEDRGKKVRKQIIALMPAWRWELHDKLEKSYAQILHHVNILINAGALKERPDGLLQAEGKPFPEADLWPKMRDGRQSKLRIKLLESLPEGEAVTDTELSQKVGISHPAAYYHLRNFERRGILIKDEYGKLQLSEFGRKIKNHESGINPETWAEAQRLSQTSIQQYKARYNARKARSEATRNKILTALEEGPLRLSEVTKKMGVPSGTVYFRMGRLKSEGLVDKQPGRFGKWFLVKSLPKQQHQQKAE